MDLTSFSDDKLSTLILEAQAELRVRHERRKAELPESIRTQADALGLDPADLLSVFSKRSGRPRPSSTSAGNGAEGRSAVKPKYRNPKNPSETWAGRGAKPKWYEAHLAKGGKPEDMLIPDVAA
ncbi:MAG: H-NS histone family protein [Polyangiaceae bacterium]|jgi:DNA-binding protein H-NS